MIRLLLVEQLYRAHTILKGESYHHDWVAAEWVASCEWRVANLIKGLGRIAMRPKSPMKKTAFLMESGLKFWMNIL
jgi:hypothetical protein